MKCSKCGKEINEQAKFCKYCGTPVQIEKKASPANATNKVYEENSKKDNDYKRYFGCLNFDRCNSLCNKNDQRKG